MANNIVNLAGELISRAKLAARAGITFGTKRDLYDKLGYQRNLDFADYYARYRRGGIAARIVDAFPEATWRNRPMLESPNEEFVEAFNKLAKRLKLYSYLVRADKLSGVGRYGILLIGTTGGSSLETPVRKLRGPEDIIYLSPFSENHADIKRLTSNTSSPRFGMPELYNVDLSGNLDEAPEMPLTKKMVHHTRLLHLAEGLEEDDIYGKPRLEKVWNYLDDLDKISGATGEAYWLVADRGIQFNLDKDANLDPADADDLSDEIDEYMHGLRRAIKTQGIETNVLGSETPDPRGPFAMIGALISGSTKIPQRVLFGSEAGQLASTQDERNFNAIVKERQENYAGPSILRPFIEHLMDIGALPEADFDVEWPDPSTLTAREKADVAARVAQSVANVAKQTAKGGKEIITPGEFREKFLDLPPEPDSGALDVSISDLQPQDVPPAGAE